MILVREISGFSADEDAQRSELVLHQSPDLLQMHVIWSKRPRPDIVGTHPGGFDVVVDSPDHRLMPAGSPDAVRFRKIREVSERRNIVRTPRTDDAAVHLPGGEEVVFRTRRIGCLAEGICELRRTLFIPVNRIAEETGGMLCSHIVSFRTVEVEELRRIGEPGFDRHERLGVIRRPDFRPVLLLLKRSSERLVVHRTENLPHVSARMREAFPARIK